MNKPSNIIFLGATGAVGGEALNVLLQEPGTSKITLLGRREVPDMPEGRVSQHKIDVTQPETYDGLIDGHDVAICTLGVGEPSKVSKEQFLKIDKTAVLAFAKACKSSGVKHFELLASVGIDANSSSFYLRTKGELVEELKALNFDRLSIFQPSMIITPENRYGVSQALTLAAWPVIDKLFFGGARKYKGIKVEYLGGAMARNVFTTGSGDEFLVYDDFLELIAK
jgi:uncharacterized protein YbjT (DUF2867 family)